MVRLPKATDKTVMCEKKAFPSRRDAQHAIKSIKRSRVEREKKPHRAYRCEECGQYHLTSKHNYGVHFDDEVTHQKKKYLKKKKAIKERE